MDRCKHVEQLQLAQGHSILDPQKWYCMVCNTTESIWACLSCSHVACGKYIQEHALKHFQESSHPVAFEVNDMYAFCYLCNDYVLNDNAAGDLKSLRSTLSTIKSKKYPCVVPSDSVLYPVDAQDRVYSLLDGTQSLPGNEDPTCAALWHRRRALMGKAFRTWFEQSAIGRKGQEPTQERMVAKREAKRRQQQELEQQMKAELESTPPRKSLRLQGSSEEAATIEIVPVRAPPPPPASPAKDKAALPTSEDRTFKKLDLNQWLAVAASDKARSYKHSAVTEAAGQQMNEGQEKEKGFACSRHSGLSSGLSGGASKGRNMELIQPREPSSPYSSLCHELHILFQVMWSGEWALVSPFAMLHSVWRLIPAFRGYAQQDAQEFLCELLDKIQRELETTGTKLPALIPTSQRRLIEQVLNVVNNIFHGQFLSQVWMSCHIFIIFGNSYSAAYNWVFCMDRAWESWWHFSVRIDFFHECVKKSRISESLEIVLYLWKQRLYGGESKENCIF
nr:Ubiquitin specific peptidase 44 [Mus musculus]BAC40148.1 unnamed protein product [Mus musculus]